MRAPLICSLTCSIKDFMIRPTPVSLLHCAAATISNLPAVACVCVFAFVSALYTKQSPADKASHSAKASHHRDACRIKATNILYSRHRAAQPVLQTREVVPSRSRYQMKVQSLIVKISFVLTDVADSQGVKIQCLIKTWALVTQILSDIVYGVTAWARI